MTEDPAIIGDLDPASSILFLGSGFSLSAKTIGNHNPPNGSELRNHFISCLQLPTDTTYTVQVLAEEYAEQNADGLARELCSIFRISSLSTAQTAILSERWRRIYTTNYDDCVETHRIKSKETVNSYDISDPIPNKLHDGSIIHLHGSIREVTAENVKSSLVLGELSYVKAIFKRSLWYDQFQNDLRFAKHLFVVGYSMSDYHIAALLLADPNLASRTFFIQDTTFNEIFVRRTRDYGRVLFIGVSGFADALRTLPRTPQISNVANLKSFRSMSPVRDRKGVADPTAGEVFDLLVYGKLNAGRLARSLPRETYAIGRRERVLEAASMIERSRSIVVEGRLGNGKTMFLHLLAFELTAKDFNCYLYRPATPDIAREIELLRSLPRVVVFIDHYSTAQDVLQMLDRSLPEARFVVEVRTAIYEVRFHEIGKIIPRPYARLSLNQFLDTEREALVHLCEQAGISTAAVSDTAKELRDLLLEMFANRSILSEIDRTLQPIFASQARRRLLIMATLVASSQSAVEPGFIRAVVDIDPFIEFKQVEDVASEVFEITSDSFRARSSIFAEYVVDAFLQPDEIANCVVELTREAALRKSTRRYRILMSSLMAYGNLRRILNRKFDVISLIINVYEKLRREDAVSDEPLFWLQYAIAMSELPRLDAAWEYIQTAYRTARERAGYQTYQIDTQAFRIALMLATTEESGRRISYLEEVMEGLSRINGMLSEDSHRSYAIKVLEGIPQFVFRRVSDMSLGERTAMVFWLNTVTASLVLLPTEFKAVSRSEAIRQGLEEAIRRISSAG